MQGKPNTLKMPFQEEMQVLWGCPWLFIMECMHMLAGKLISLDLVVCMVHQVLQVVWLSAKQGARLV